LSQVVIKPACLRDASFVMANLRPIDQLEAFCQLPDGVTSAQLAHYTVASSKAFVAYLDSQPVMVFGSSTINVCTVSLWALGTRKSWRVIPAVTRFMRDFHIPALIDSGVTLGEARSLLTHTQAHKWMRDFGAEVSGEPFVYGKGGELFQLFRWTVAGYRSICEGQEKTA